LAPGLLSAQVGDVFPTLSGETVLDETVTIPEDTNDKYTLVGLAYSKKSEQDLQTWFSPSYNLFVRDKEDAGVFASFTYDVNLFFVPMFTGVKAAAAGTAKKKALKLADERLWPHIIFYKGALKEYKESLSFDRKDVPYFFVIDKEGKIRYATSGAYSEEKMDEIEDIIAE
jgi:hypothetical protein